MTLLFQPSSFDVRVKIEELRDQIRQLRQDHRVEEASTLAKLAQRLEGLLALRGSLTSR